jgi:hypothetical protein
VIEAVIVKLQAQADYVQWWDENRLKGRPEKVGGHAKLLAGKDGVPTRGRELINAQPYPY